jgi:hypothetical protein
MSFLKGRFSTIEYDVIKITIIICEDIMMNKDKKYVRFNNKLRNFIIFTSAGDDGAREILINIDFIENKISIKADNIYNVESEEKIINDEQKSKLKNVLRKIKFEKWDVKSEDDFLFLGGSYWEIKLIYENNTNIQYSAYNCVLPYSRILTEQIRQLTGNKFIQL